MYSYQNGRIVVETDETGAGQLFYVDNQNRRQRIQTTDATGRPVAFLPGNLAGCDGGRTEAKVLQ